jgi:hypothetical protein
MLPSLRFLLAAILLSISILVFGLGAAALLRAAHEEFASNPSWRATRQTRFAQLEETDRPTLAMLHIESQADTAKMTDAPSAMSLGAATTPSTAPAVAEPPATEAERPSAATTSPPPETADVQAPPPDAPPPGDSAPVAATTDGPVVAEEVKTAATEEASPPQSIPSPVNAEATREERSNAPPATEIVAPLTRLTSQGDQTVTVAEPAKIDAKPEHGATKPHPAAQHAKAKARRISARARPAQQQAAAVQPAPFLPLFELEPLPQATPARKP